MKSCTLIIFLLLPLPHEPKETQYHGEHSDQATVWQQVGFWDLKSGYELCWSIFGLSAPCG